MRRSSSLQAALYRDSSKRVAEIARMRLRQLDAFVTAPAPAPRWGRFLLAALLATGALASCALFL